MARPPAELPRNLIDAGDQGGGVAGPTGALEPWHPAAGDLLGAGDDFPDRVALSRAQVPGRRWPPACQVLESEHVGFREILHVAEDPDASAVRSVPVRSQDRDVG